MRYLAKLLLCGLLALPAVAQRGGGMHAGGGGARGGGGFHAGGGFHGGGGFVGGGFRGGGFNRFGGFHNGFFPRNRFFFGAGFGFSPWAYSYPFFYDNGYYGYPYGSDYGYYPPPNYDNGSTASPIVIYQTMAPPVAAYEPPARPEIHEYPDPAPASAPSRSYEKPIYLIAFRNQDNIRAAEAYWVEGSMLHYVTLQHEHKQAPLDSVDRAFSSRLNRERRVDFRLPPAP